jgi:hypothetical protein
MDSISLNLAKRNPYKPKTRKLLGGYQPGWAIFTLEKV